jgi:hypothetical protein
MCPFNKATPAYLNRYNMHHVLRESIAAPVSRYCSYYSFSFLFQKIYHGYGVWNVKKCEFWFFHVIFFQTKMKLERGGFFVVIAL